MSVNQDARALTMDEVDLIAGGAVARTGGCIPPKGPKGPKDPFPPTWPIDPTNPFPPTTGPTFPY